MRRRSPRHGCSVGHGVRDPGAWPISLLAVGLVFGVAIVRVVARFGDPWSTFGDEALIELSTRLAADGAHLVGAYSRFGWHHPGPAWFYLAAPFSALSGDAPRAVILAAVSVNAAAGLALVGVVRRRAGELAARWAAAVVGVYVVLIGVDRLWSAWNPHVIVLPVALAVVLAAAGARGSWWSLVAAVAVASVAMQSHIGTVPTMGLVLAAGAVGWSRAWRRGVGDRPARTWPALLAGAGLVGALWLPPVWQQLTDERGNLGQLLAFTRDPPEHMRSGHPPQEAIPAVADQVAVIPLGVAPERDEPAGHGPRLAVTALTVTAGALVWRRRGHGGGYPATLAGLGVLGIVVAMLAAMRVVGPYAQYLLLWTSALALPIWIAVAGTRLQGRRSSLARRTAAAALLATMVAAWHVGGENGQLRRHAHEIDEAVVIAERALEATGEDTVVVRLPPERFHVATGLVNALHRRGWDVRVESAWARTFGTQMAERGDEPVALELSTPQDTGTHPPDRRRVGTVTWSTTGEVTELWLQDRRSEG